MVADVLHEHLAIQGYQCHESLDGSKAFAQLAVKNFDIVLLDIKLPDMSGMEMIQEIRLRYRNTAVIMLTATNDVVTAVEAMKLGAEDYIVKPFDLDEVDGKINRALNSRHSSSVIQQQMDAIAIGVEAKLDPFAFHSKIVIERTTEIARTLGIVEQEVQKWMKHKSGHVAEGRQLAKLARNGSN